MMIFYDAHKPVLKDGNYTITVDQDITVLEYPSKSPAKKTFSANTMFTVNGPRFNLSPSDVHSIFPHEGAKGDFQNFLPYIVFNRSTLPWEREPLENQSVGASWLYLLIVDEDEITKSNVVEKILTYNNIKDNTELNQTLVGINDPDDLKIIDENISINYIRLEKNILSYIPTSLNDLSLLSYVRIKDELEEAVIVSNRLPSPGKSSIAYLISLENKFTADGSLNSLDFVFLKKWKFYTEDEQIFSFGNGNLSKLISSDSTIESLLDISCTTNNSTATNFEDFKKYIVKLNAGQTLTDVQYKLLKHCCKLPGSTFHEILSNLKGGTNFLISEASDDIAKLGSALLPWQHLDDKGFVVYDLAWYRGPLVSKNLDITKAKFNKDVALYKDNSSAWPIFCDSTGFFPKNSDELKINFNGSIDCTYASAYELGKLTALNDNAFSAPLFEWKMNYARNLINVNNEQNSPTSHLSVCNSTNVNLPLPAKVTNKIDEWKLLKGMPFRYLVPDPNYLPHESLRIFQIDANWVNAFICGAFSIGFVPSTDFRTFLTSLFLKESYYGFILNSLAVKVWPDYELEVLSDSSPFDLNPDFTKDLKWKKNLDTSTHIYIFDKPFGKLKFHLHPGKLLPGFMLEDGVFYKNGKPLTSDKTSSNPSQSPIDQETRVMNLAELKNNLTLPVSASSFNAWLMEGTPEVVITIN